MADKDTPIYDKTRMRGTTWVDATRILFNMGSELEEQVDGMDYEGVKQDLADEIINRQNADTQLGNRIDTLGTQVNQNKSDITQIKETINQMEDNATALGASVADIQSDVAENKGNIQANSGKIEVLENEYAGFNSEQISLRTDLTEVQADVDGIKTSLVSDVITKAGSTIGTIIVELEREDGTKISAQDFNYGKPTSMELLQGSSEGMMKAQFTLSDGTTIQSNDFQVLEQITGDVYITSFTFKNGSSQGKISAVIGLSDGRTLDANDFQLPTDPQIQSNITNLLSRMNAVEEKNNQQDTNISALSTRMDTAESNIAGNDADIAQLKSEDETIKGDITSLDARVKAIEDTPGVGKFELGKLGTIMGSSDNGKISANPDGTGSVNGWDSVATVDELADYLKIVEAEADYLKKIDAESTYAKKTDVSGIGITTSGNTATVNGKNANIVNSISGRVDENNNLIINVNGVESGGIPLPDIVEVPVTEISYLKITENIEKYLDIVEDGGVQLGITLNDDSYMNILAKDSIVYIKGINLISGGFFSNINGYSCNVVTDEIINYTKNALSKMPDGDYKLVFANILNGFTIRISFGDFVTRVTKSGENINFTNRLRIIDASDTSTDMTIAIVAIC